MAICYLLILILFFFNLADNFFNMFGGRIDICDINIARCSKGIPDHPAPVLYPFITVLTFGAGGAVSI